MKYTVYICEDHKIVTDGVWRILDNSDKFEPIGACASAEDLMGFLEHTVPDVLILDLNLPKRSGLDCLPDIRSQFPDMFVVILTMHRDAVLIKKIKDLGAAGFLLKDFGEEEMLLALKTIIDGDLYFPDLLYAANENEDATKALFLTQREKEIVNHTAQGLSTPDIAEKLFLSPHTVNTHRRNIYKKLGVENIKELITYAHANGLV